MNNEEGTRENVSEVASLDPFDPFLSKSDGGGDASPLSLSRYSSCGESEFERYCSANSVMGTPSMHSSFGKSFNNCLDSEFGSFRSLGIGDDVSFENFSLGGNPRLSLGDGRIQFLQGRNDEDAKIDCGFSGLRLYDDNGHEGRKDDVGMKINSTGMSSDDTLGGSVSNLSIQGIGGRSVVGDGVGNGAGIEPEVEGGSLLRGDNQGKDNCLEGLDMQLRGEFKLREMEGEEDGTSSRYEHSEGEDSMYNYGSDDEHRVNSYYPRNVEYVQQSKCENENPFLINSHVAFGSEDWDDLEQEVAGSNPSSSNLDKLQYKRELHLESERKLQNFTSLTPIRFASDSQKEQRNDVAILPVLSKEVQGIDETKENINHSITTLPGIPCFGEVEHVEEVKDIPVADYQVQGVDMLVEETNASFPTSTGFPRSSGSEQDVRDILVTGHQVQGSNDVTMHLYNSSVSDVFETEQNPQVEKALFKIGLDMIDSATERNHHVNTKEVISNGGCGENLEFKYFKAGSDPFADVSMDQHCSDSTVSLKELNSNFLENHETKVSPSKLGNIMIASKSSPASADLFKDHPAANKRENFELNDFCDEIVHEMEEILLDYSESPGVRFSQGNQMFQSQLSLPPRDGGSTASTAGTDDAYPLTLLLLRIDGVEVVGAKQKKGDVSLSERLVGVKEYTLYRIKVWSGKDQWEVERRYRDFFTLYRRLKSLFTDQGWILPSPWSSVEKESRKIFGNSSPDVVAERSVLIQECLQSILHSTYFSSPPSALIWFLSPQESLPSSPASNTLVDQSKSFTRSVDAEKISTLGKTISLIVEVRPYKSIKQMLEVQHYTCGGCHKHFDDGMTLMQGLVQTFGWGKPRLCEYTGQLFCSSCHTSETAVLPARVLHHWDFTCYPVCQLAKSYLDSVHDQPMLCVSAVNPFLFSKVPALRHVMGLRKKIGNMLPLVRCPFRRSINKGLGSRRYFLESNEFFALRDLIDLSKGPFAALPVMVENVSRQILEHITEQCLICCDVGVPCSARQACNDPSSLIFTFQEGEVERCKSCEASFHKPCFRRLAYCPCGTPLGVGEAGNSTKRVSHNAHSNEANKSLTLLGNISGSGLSIGLLSGLFSKAKPEKAEHKDSDTVILMDSLPSTSL